MHQGLHSILQGTQHKFHQYWDAAGMLLMAKQFDAEVVGVGIFIASEEPENKAVPAYRSLLTLSHRDGKATLFVTPEK